MKNCVDWDIVNCDFGYNFSNEKFFYCVDLQKTKKWQIDVPKIIFEFKRYFCHVVNFLLHFAKTSLVKKDI